MKLTLKQKAGVLALFALLIAAAGCNSNDQNSSAPSGASMTNSTSPMSTNSNMAH